MKIANIIFALMLFALFVNACTKTEQSKQKFDKIPSDDVSLLSPEQVVQLYFQAWNNKHYNIMYSLISDGFKQIDPTANTFEKFKSSMEELFNVASGVSVIDVKEVSRDDKEAVVNFKIQIIRKDGTKQELSKTFTLKKRANGWKLIHPYGNNIDTT